MKTIILIIASVISCSFAQAQFQATYSYNRSATWQDEAFLHEMLKSSVVLASQYLFTEKERQGLHSLNASYLSATRKITFKNEAAYLFWKTELKRRNLPVYIDALDLDIKVQGEPLEKSQWGLSNSGVPQSIDIDYLVSYKVSGIANQDIHLPSPIVGKKIRVAVLDTGIDINHPDLRNVIVRNTSECAALEKFKACLAESDRKTCEKKWFDLNNPEVDLDKNGYPLDCSGWSLMGGINSADIMGRPDFGDDHGHGTHVAGIIGAETSNGIGIKGVSNNVEILPIQVIGVSPSEPIKPMSVDLNPKESARLGKGGKNLADFVARGVIYAIHSKADIMNFSIGWPDSRDSDFMRQVIEEAQNRGIIIVAAAGNDSTDALLRPCAYQGVICVAAHGPDGGISHFSNFGFGVDLAAPGTNIISTYPTSKRSIRVRSQNGYEYLHGTSQATPMVTGAAAELLSRGIPTHEVRPRLIIGSRPPLEAQPILIGAPHRAAMQKQLRSPYKKTLLGGNLDLTQALATQSQPLIIPLSKEITPIKWNRSDSALKWPVKLMNLWSPVDFKDVQVSIENKNVSDKNIFTITHNLPTEQGEWQQNQIVELMISIEIHDGEPLRSRLPSDPEVILSIKLPGRSQKDYTLKPDIIVPIAPETQASDILVLPLEGTPRGRTTTMAIDEVYDSDSDFHDYFFAGYEPSEWSYSLLNQDRSSIRLPYKNRGKFTINSPEFPDAVREHVLARLDIDGDSNSEYILGLLTDANFIEDKERSHSSVLTLYILSQNMQLQKTYQIDSEKVELPEKVRWMQLGNIKTPAWLAQGKDPKKKASLVDLWENPEQYENPELRFYYLDEKGELNSLQQFDGYSIVDVLEPTNEQVRRGQVPILLAQNRGSLAKPSYLYNFAVGLVENGKVQIEKTLMGSSDSYRNLLDTRVDSVFSLLPGPEKWSGTFWFGEGAPQQQRLSVFNNQTLLLSNFDLSSLRNSIDAALWVRSVYSSPERMSAFVLTNSEIQFHDLSQNKVVSKSLERYTFFENQMVTNFHFPTLVSDRQNQSQRLPSLYLTQTTDMSRALKVIVPNYSSSGELLGLSVPAKMRFVTEKGCKPLESPVLQTAGIAIDYLCRDKILRVNLEY